MSKLRIVYGRYSVSKLRIVIGVIVSVNCLLFVMGVIMSVKFEFHLVDVMVSVSRDLHLVGVIVSVSCESLLVSEHQTSTNCVLLGHSVSNMLIVLALTKLCWRKKQPPRLKTVRNFTLFVRAYAGVLLLWKTA